MTTETRRVSENQGNPDQKPPQHCQPIPTNEAPDQAGRRKLICARCGFQFRSAYPPELIHRACPAPPRDPDQIEALLRICRACKLFAADHCRLDEGCQSCIPASRFRRRLEDRAGRCELGKWGPGLSPPQSKPDA